MPFNNTSRIDKKLEDLAVLVNGVVSESKESISLVQPKLMCTTYGGSDYLASHYVVN